jgi:hypothetical protein
MKTITEFSGFALREALAKSKEIQTALGTEGKTAEELATSLKEALAGFLAEKFKLEGERMELFGLATEIAGKKAKELENLKRVVVYALAEGEKAIGAIQTHGIHGFLAEYLPPVRGKGQQDRRQAGTKHGPKDGKGGKGKKGRGRRRPDLKGNRPDGGAERRGANSPKPASP